MGAALVSLETLADRINAKMNEAEAAHRTALERAKEAGELLIEAKDRVPHGQWLPWLADNCRVSADMAGKWMKLAREWPALVSAHSEQVPYLGVKEALRLLAKPKQAKGPAQQQAVTIEGEPTEGAVEPPGPFNGLPTVEAGRAGDVQPAVALEAPSVETLLGMLEDALLAMVPSERAKAAEAAIDHLYGFQDEHCKDRMTLAKLRQSFPDVGMRELRKEVVEFVSALRGGKVAKDRNQQEGIAADLAEEFIRLQREQGWKPGLALVRGAFLRAAPTTTGKGILLP